MPNYYLSVLYKHIIQVKNKNVGLKVGGGGTNIPLPPQSKKWRAHAPLAAPPPPASYASVYIYIFRIHNGTSVIYRQWRRKVPKSGGGGHTDT